MHTSAIDLIATLIDPVAPQKSGPGHPRAETVTVVRTVRSFAPDGVGWRTLTASDRFVSGSPVRRWLERWFANGTWHQRTWHQSQGDLVRALRSAPGAAAEAVGIVVDRCRVRATHGGDLVAPNPPDRGQPGPKYQVVPLTDGTPLGGVASKANLNDTIWLPHLRKRAQAVCTSRAKLFADAGYDSRFNRTFCRKQGVEPLLRRRGEGHGSGLGKVRHIVENAISWLLSNKRVDRRHDRSTLVVPSLLNFACVYGVAHRLAEE